FLEGTYLPLSTDTTAVPARVVAFARLSAGGAVIAVAPHLVARLLSDDHPVPIGDLWKTSRVILPPSLASLTYRDAFTGAEVRPVKANESAWLFVGQVLRH